MEHVVTDSFALASQFINSTSRHLFLTGKAGTGKTTFLKNLRNATHKSFLVVAPTGIAALNAGGVTIHSQFLLPPGTFIPDRNPEGLFGAEGQVITQHTLVRSHPLSASRRQVLKGIDLLVIDEVSMLRADVLDAIDFRLRHVKRRPDLPFGGVQLLLIGDLYQLPPVVKEQEWNYLRRYYGSIWFYEARALQAEGFVYVELEKIFRQQDDLFIGILNRLRDNVVTHDDIRLLNQHVKTEEEIRAHAETITLTTHNYKADELNRRAMDGLPGKARFYEAEIDGEFPPQIYPVAESLELKAGAQVMFIKNDNEQGMYFNGKLATVLSLGNEIVVELADSAVRYTLRREKWENKKYTLNASSREVEEVVIGTFMQYPIRLAWAITVHKSQGLTFDKAVIDVGQAFAAGQVYVALSRLRTLDGLMLRTPISTAAVSTDEEIVAFSRKKQDADGLRAELKEGQRAFTRRLIAETFDFSALLTEVLGVMNNQEERPEFEDAALSTALPSLREALSAETTNTERFRRQLQSLLESGEYGSLHERAAKGSAYYRSVLLGMSKTLLFHVEHVKTLSGNKGYLQLLEELDTVLARCIGRVTRCPSLLAATQEEMNPAAAGPEQDDWRAERSAWIEQAREAARSSQRSTATKTGRKRKPRKKNGESNTAQSEKDAAKAAKKNTVTITLEAFRSGKTVEEIAAERKLSCATIETHLTRCIGLGEIEASALVSPDIIRKVEEGIGETGFTRAGDLFQFFGGNIGYTPLGYVLASLRRHNGSAGE